VRDHIKDKNWHLDVDSEEPRFSSMYERKSVHFVEPHVSWVQIDVNQFGLYILVDERVSKTSTQGLVKGIIKWIRVTSIRFN